MTTTFSLADAMHEWTYAPRASTEKRYFNKGRLSAAKLDLRIALRSAKRFSLDDEFTRQAVLQSSTPDGKIGAKVLGMVDLANLPFDKVFVEFDLETRVRAQIESGATKIDSPDASVIGARGGFLMERHTASDASLYFMSYMTAPDPELPSYDDAPSVSLAGYVLDTQGKNRLPDTAQGFRYRYLQDMVDGCAWGTTFTDPANSDRVLFAVSDELRRRGRCIPEMRFFTALTLDDGERAEAFIRMAAETAGNLRFVASCFAMVNNVPIRYLPAKASGAYTSRGRNIQFLERQTITIHAGKVRNLRAYVDRMFAIAARRRRHDVRGFWRNVEYGKSSVCVHEPVERDGDYALCSKCQCLIKWVDHHERGDISLGRVDHKYEVKV